jgi:hypothetical protein
MRSPLRAASLCVVLGPANTLPHQAQWCFEFNIFATEVGAAPESKSRDEEPFPKGRRALLWYKGKPHFPYQNCLVLNKCRLSHTDELLTHSVVVRAYGDESDQKGWEDHGRNVHALVPEPDSLTWVRKRAGASRRKDLSYLKVKQGHHYYLQITFETGSMIAQKVGSESWRPIMFLYTKRTNKGVDEVQSTRLFTNFTTNWAPVAELDVDEAETKYAREAMVREQEEDSEDKAQAKAGSGVNTAAPRKNVPTGTSSGRDHSRDANNPPNPIGSVIAMDKKTRGGAAPTAANVGTPYAPQPTPASSAGAQALMGLLQPMGIAPFATHDLSQSRSSASAVTLEQLINAFKKYSLAQIRLPDLDSKAFHCDLPIEATVERFLKPNESALGDAICNVETAARIAAQEPANPIADASKHLLNFFSAVTQLPGWLHVQRYISHPQKYIERTKAGQVLDDHSSPIMDGTIEDLTEKGRRLMRRLCQRVNWLIYVYTQAGKPFDAEFAMQVLAADHRWADDANAFMKDAEVKVTEMLTKHPQKFHGMCAPPERPYPPPGHVPERTMPRLAFRELQRKGVQWPHSTVLRQEIERAGFVFRPMMIKRDRCICETCGVEVSGWRTWHNPAALHNLQKHNVSTHPANAAACDAKK